MTEAIRQGDIPGVQLRRRRRFAGVDGETLWAWLRESDKLERWAADEARVDPGETGGLELVEASGGRELGDTVELRPATRWALAFRREDWAVATRLELEITVTGDGAELSILQNGFEHLPLSEGLTLWEAYRRRWSAALDRLEAALRPAAL